MNLPTPPASANERALAAYTMEEFTGLTTALVTLSHEPQAGTVTVVKNGSTVRPSTFSSSGKVVTLGSALIAGDWVVVTYWARPGTY